jgi:hypothetical protein
MLTSEDVKWLSDDYPSLKYADGKVSGTLEFIAAYNKDSNRFLNIKNGITDEVGGLRLSGKFVVSIEERAETPYSKLPALYIEGIDPIPARHFNRTDNSACLGTPLEEEEFLEPNFSFQKYLEELVIPFLYGQVYYSANQSWPWFDYDHGGIGLIQSFCKIHQEFDEPSITGLLSYLKKDAHWSLFKEILTLPRPSKRLCPCGLANKLRDCHPEIMDGMNKLKSAIIEYKLSLD